MSQLIILPGAIVRKSTLMWMKTLSEHFEPFGFSCHRFMWSGIPSNIMMKYACYSFKKFYNDRVESEEDTYIYAKSLGADIVNISYNDLILKPKIILFVAPSFKLSSKIENFSTSELYNLNLSHDRFITKWERFGIVHKLKLPGKTYTIINDESFDHHELNWNSSVTLEELGTTHLYDLYDQIFQVT
ncbi:MAG: hypothetical protein P9L92_11560 [Candidatus Electryonea clarkiae]|nr:hypothetical protein [Candidatus Electryonea clarkiae]MDP8285622.1 hypothetical protein [Candidatus Electryonea clarkiae]